MSFILDAIAKSERERQQQHTPDARSLAFPAAAPARSRSAAPYVLAALLLAIAILAAVWIQSPRPVATPFVGSGGTVEPAVPEAANPPQAPVESRDALPAVPAETPQPKSATPLLAESAAAESVARAQPRAAAEAVEAPAIEAAAARSARESAPASATPAPATGSGAGDTRQASLGTDSGGAPATAEAAPPAQSEAPRRRVSRLSELPADVRRALPSVVFTGHLYSRNPRASYVFIDNGRQIVAGQQIANDLVLDEITPTGVVVEFQGYLIEVGVLQNWSLK